MYVCILTVGVQKGCAKRYSWFIWLFVEGHVKEWIVWPKLNQNIFYFLINLNKKNL